MSPYGITNYICMKIGLSMIVMFVAVYVIAVALISIFLMSEHNWHYIVIFYGIPLRLITMLCFPSRAIVKVATPNGSSDSKGKALSAAGLATAPFVAYSTISSDLNKEALALSIYYSICALAAFWFYFLNESSKSFVGQDILSWILEDVGKISFSLIFVSSLWFADLITKSTFNYLFLLSVFIMFLEFYNRAYKDFYIYGDL